MNLKIGKLPAILLFLVVVVVLYRTDTMSLWRHYNNGVRDFNSKKFQKASINFSRALELSDNPVLRYNWAISRWRALDQGETPDTTSGMGTVGLKAKHLLGDLTDLIQSSDVPDSLRAEIYYVQGRLAMAIGDTSQAIMHYEAALQEQAGFNPALHALLETHKYGEAQGSVSHLIDLTKSTSAIKDIEIVGNFKPF